MAIQYQIESGVLILRVAPVGFESLRGAVHAAIHQPSAHPKRGILIDVRSATVGMPHEDVQSLVQILPQIQDHFGPRWAVLVGTGPMPAGVARMFAFFTRVAGLEVGLFVDRGAAMEWVR